MSQSSEGLSTLLRRVVEDYPIEQIGKGISPHVTREDIETRIPERIQELLQNDDLVIKSSAGRGRWTAIPWVAIMDPRETDRIQDGIYVVYLFEPQENRVTLTLNQGVTELKDELGTKAARQRLRETANGFYENLSIEGFQAGPIDFPHASSRNELYGPGTITYKRYSLESIPDDDSLRDDLETLVSTYQEQISPAHTPNVYQCPIKGGGIMEQNYEDTVLEGVSRERLEGICDIPVEHEDLRVWGNRSSTAANPGDYLLFAERDGPSGGEYTVLARIADATVFDAETAREFSEAVGWTDESETAFPHKMFLEPLYKAKLNRADFWDLMGFKGWPNDSYSRLDFERQESSFFSKYRSVTDFLEKIKGEQIYPQSSTLNDYWQTIDTQQQKAETFLANPTEGSFRALLNSLPWYVSRWTDSKVEKVFEEATPHEVADIIQDSADEGNIGPVLNFGELGVGAASELLASVSPEKFARLNKEVADAVEAMRFDRPNPNTTSPSRYDTFLDDVEQILEQYSLREFVWEIPDWATDLQVATYAFHLHETGELDLTELVPVDPFEELESLLEQEASQAHLYRQAAAHLVAGKNVVFYGPPGTGKTRAANLLSDALCASKSLVTANAEWSNYQVVGGYRPVGNSWEAEAGFLTSAASKCVETLRRDTPQPSWVIIDELNRANLDEAFGDVFTLLDLDYRTTEPLSYANREVYVPLSFRILATMNTYDQAQLFSLGYAFRRRFAFVNVPSLLDNQKPPEGSTEDGIPSEAPELNSSDEKLVALVEKAAIDAMATGGNGGGVTSSDVAPIFPEFASRKTLSDALNTVSTKPELQRNGLDAIQTLIYFCIEVTDQDVVDIGQALLIDATKYLIAHQLLFPDETSREALDDALVAYIVPQFEHFMSELRRAETIDRDSDAKERFNRIIQLARDLALPKTATVLAEAGESKQILS
ncbi:MrcB family domain-containing protein [Halomarina salina]|uniref:MrcB family domain-containing protein n=1 Tax=Halomarina salina TaxID=1872699 RepID=A0ABD5RPR8_9EURY|nr:DUF3578 domain-containing protein [Halomarina salina]